MCTARTRERPRPREQNQNLPKPYLLPVLTGSILMDGVQKVPGYTSFLCLEHDIEFDRGVLPTTLCFPFLNLDSGVLPICVTSTDRDFVSRVLPFPAEPLSAPVVVDDSWVLPAVDYTSGVLPSCQDNSFDDPPFLKVDSIAKCIYFIDTEGGEVSHDDHPQDCVGNLRFSLRGGGKSKDRKKLQSMRKAESDKQVEEYALTEGSEIDTSLLEPSWIHDEEDDGQTFEEAPEPAGMFCFPTTCSDARGDEQKFLIMCSACEFPYWFEAQHWAELGIQEDEFECSCIGRACQEWANEENDGDVNPASIIARWVHEFAEEGYNEENLLEWLDEYDNDNISAID